MLRNNFYPVTGSFKAGFFFDRAAPKKLKNEKLKTQGKTQNSSKKLKDSAHFGPIYSKIQRK